MANVIIIRNGPAGISSALYTTKIMKDQSKYRSHPKFKNSEQ